MIIRLSGGDLDISEENVGISWENIRFSGGLSDAFTSDITIPATNENIRILNASGLLDSPNQMFGDYITPATLSMSGMPPMDVRLQVTGVTDDEISVTLYEATIPTEFYDKKLTDIFTDDQDTIWVWSTNTYGNEPTYFRRYNYGMNFSGWRAMYHPVMKLNNIIDDINTETGYNLPHTDDDLFMMASKKCVCPQNPIQVIEWWRSSGHYFNLVGGQHIVNDVEGIDNDTKVMESSTQQIKFNRHCRAEIKTWWSFKVQYTTQNYDIHIQKNGVDLGLYYMDTSYWEHDFGAFSTINTTFEAGDVLEIWGNFNLHQKMCDIVTVITYSDYEIDENDYGTELLYRGNHPSLHFFPTNDPEEAEDMWFDYRTWTKQIGRDTSQFPATPIYRSVTLPYVGFCYFGYWANVPEISVKDLLYGLCFYMGKKIKTSNYNVEFVPSDTSVDVEGIVTNKQPVSDKLGKTNIIKWLGDDTNPLRIEFNNRFLSDSVTLHESPFAYVGGQNNPFGTIPLAVIPQYSLEQDSNEDWSVKYDEIEGLVIVRNAVDDRTWRYLAQPASLTDLGIGKLNTVMQCTIETFSNAFGYDFVYLDGRKYMVISGEKDAETGITTLETLLMSTSVPDSWNIIIIGTITGLTLSGCDNLTVTWRDSSNIRTKKKLVVYKQESGGIPVVSFDTITPAKTAIKGTYRADEGSGGKESVYGSYDVTDLDSYTLEHLPDGNYRIELNTISYDDKYMGSPSALYYKMVGECGQDQPSTPTITLSERTASCDNNKSSSEARVGEKRYLGIADCDIKSGDITDTLYWRFVKEDIIEGVPDFPDIDDVEWKPYLKSYPFDYYVMGDTQTAGSYQIQAKAVGANGVESFVKEVIWSGHAPTSC